MSTRPRFFLGAVDSAAGRSAGLSLGPGGNPSLFNSANGFCPKLGPPSVGKRLSPLMISISRRPPMTARSFRGRVALLQFSSIHANRSSATLM
jgi:hypothetical protein